jgi:hypothetical protein
MTSADEILTQLDAPAVLAAANRRRTQRAEPEKPGLPVPPPSHDPVMFGGIVGELALAADPTTEADPAGVLASLLAGAGVAAGPKPHVQVGNTRHPLLIWPLLFGRTGSGRKGEATDTAEMFLRAAVWDWADITVTGLSSGEGLIERIRDPQSEDDEGGTMDKRLCVTETEFSTVMARARREGSTLGTVLRQAWDARTLAVLTRVAYKAASPHIAIIGHIPPKEFRMRLAESDMVGGSYNRFLPVYVERSKKLPIPEGIPEPILNAEAARLRTAIGTASDLGRIHLGEQATRLWSADLYDEFTAADDEDQAWTEFTRRAAPYCLRIAALHAALDGTAIIAASHLHAAAALVRYSIRSAIYVLDRQLRDPRLDRIRRAIDTTGPEGIGRTDISGLFSRNVTRTQLDELLATLTATGQYETITAPTGGRPSVRYRRTQGTKKEERTNPAPLKTAADQQEHAPDGEHLSSYPTKKAPRTSFVADEETPRLPAAPEPPLTSDDTPPGTPPG